MEKQFLEFVAGIMKVNISDLNMETTYEDYEKWDSLMMLILIMETEAKYGIAIPMEKAGNIKTLADLYALVED